MMLITNNIIVTIIIIIINIITALEDNLLALPAGEHRGRPKLDLLVFEILVKIKFFLFFLTL